MVHIRFGWQGAGHGFLIAMVNSDCNHYQYVFQRQDMSYSISILSPTAVHYDKLPYSAFTYPVLLVHFR